MRSPNPESSLGFFALKAGAVGGFVFYLGWNAAWLARGALPPSILQGVFGVPAPTTGFLRSWKALLGGDWVAAFFWNPFAVPLAVLLLISLGWLAGRVVRGPRIVLPVVVVRGWVVTLGAAWLAKLLLSRAGW